MEEWRLGQTAQSRAVKSTAPCRTRWTVKSRKVWKREKRIRFNIRIASSKKHFFRITTILNNLLIWDIIISCNFSRFLLNSWNSLLVLLYNFRSHVAITSQVDDLWCHSLFFSSQLKKPTYQPFPFCFILPVHIFLFFYLNPKSILIVC